MHTDTIIIHTNPINRDITAHITTPQGVTAAVGIHQVITIPIIGLDIVITITVTKHI